MTDKTELTWARDDGYCCEYTARRGNWAAVIVPPEYYDDGRWGFQIFNEADEGAMEQGEWYFEGHGIKDEATAKRIAATFLGNA